MIKFITLIILVYGTAVYAVETNIKCQADEIVISTQKGSESILGAYICSKMMPTPLVIIKNEDYDEKFDENDSISFYLGKSFPYFKNILVKEFHNFKDDMKEHFDESKEKDAYFKIDIEQVNKNLVIKNILQSAQEALKQHVSRFPEFYSTNLALKENIQTEADDYDYSTRQRYYDPKTSRFLSEDPKGVRPTDPNPYAYVKNNPILYVDPQGADRELVMTSPIHMAIRVYDPQMPGNDVLIDLNPNSGTTKQIMMGSTVNGRIDIDNTHGKNAFSVPMTSSQTSRQQDSQYLQNMLNRQQNPPAYNVYGTNGGQNCIGFGTGNL